jgi:hypothetical protein
MLFEPSELKNALSEFQNSKYEQCFDIFYRYAHANYSQAQMALFHALTTDHWGLKENFPEALYWCQRAKENRHAMAFIFYGTTIYNCDFSIYDNHEKKIKSLPMKILEKDSNISCSKD